MRKNAATSGLAGFATAIPKTADGAVEMIRQLKVLHDSAVVNRSSTIIMIKAMLVHGSDELRRETNKISPPRLARHLAGSRPRNLNTPDDALRHSVRTLARRWLALDAEAKELEGLIDALVRRTAPQLLEQFGIGVDTAAEILIVAGDNPERIRSEAAFAKLAGIAPVPTGSGMTSGKHRIKPRRASPAQRRNLSNGHRQNEIPRTDHRLCRPPEFEQNYYAQIDASSDDQATSKKAA
ncbi:transposase [Arthrobacter sp. HLT1-21]